MVNATALAPQLAQADYSDIQALAGVGATKEGMDMAKIQDAMARFDFEQQKPYYKLREYLGSIGANVPTTTASTQPVFRNTAGGLLGGALTGVDIASKVPGLSTGMGAGIGGLLGGFF